MRVVCCAAVVLALCACAPTDTSTAPPGQAPDAGSGNGGAPASRLITVNASGPGAIRGAGLSGCHAQCTAQAADGAVVTFTAVPDPGAVFSGWSGSCSGSGACSFTVSRDAQVTATFALVPPPPPGKANLIVSKTGAGRVQSSPAGIDCGATCAGTFDAGSAVTLTATPDAGSRFSGWGGRCSRAGSCSVTLDSDVTVYATFESTVPARRTLTVARSGAGRVSSAPAGIDCGAGCSAQFDDGAQVQLTATADKGFTFTGWGGACSGSGTCSVALTADASVTATFAAAPDECAGLGFAAPPSPMSSRQPRSGSLDCLRGFADGKGDLALPVPAQNPDPNNNYASPYTVYLLDAATNSFARYSGESPILDEQATGFLALNSEVFSYPYLDAVDSTGHVVNETPNGSIGPQATGGQRVADDPTGGVVIATNLARTNSALISLEAYDAQARLRWRHSFANETVRATALGVDRAGDTLLLSRAGDGSLQGVWYGKDGTPGAPFTAFTASDPVAQQAFVTLVPRIGDGFFLQTLDRMNNSAPAPARWVAQVDGNAAAFAPPPAWLHAYDYKKLHPARGGTAYAFLDDPGASPDCTQRVEVVATTGKSCGYVKFNAGAAGACQTLSIDVGWDGTVIQQLTPSAEDHDSAGKQTSCSWQWWTGLLH